MMEVASEASCPTASGPLVLIRDGQAVGRGTSVVCLLRGCQRAASGVAAALVVFSEHGPRGYGQAPCSELSHPLPRLHSNHSALLWVPE